jgi:hypothetical protein
MPVAQGVPEAGPDDRGHGVKLHEQDRVRTHLRYSPDQGCSLISLVHHAEDVDQQLGRTLRDLDERTMFKLLNPRSAVRTRVLKNPDARSDVPLRLRLIDCGLGLFH